MTQQNYWGYDVCIGQKPFCVSIDDRTGEGKSIKYFNTVASAKKYAMATKSEVTTVFAYDLSGNCVAVGKMYNWEIALEKAKALISKDDLDFLANR